MDDITAEGPPTGPNNAGQTNSHQKLVENTIDNFAADSSKSQDTKNDNQNISSHYSSLISPGASDAQQLLPDDSSESNSDDDITEIDNLQHRQSTKQSDTQSAKETLDVSALSAALQSVKDATGYSNTVASNLKSPDTPYSEYSAIHSSSDTDSGTNSQVANPGSNDVQRPESLSLPRPLQYYEKKKSARRELSNSSLSSYSSSTDALIEEVSKTPLQTQGTVIKDGDQMSFVASDLTNIIKMSSPHSWKGDSSGASWNGCDTPGGRSVSSLSSSTSGWSTSNASSASGWTGMSRLQPPHTSGKLKKVVSQKRSPSILTASPEDIPPIDPRAMIDLEHHSFQVAESLFHMMGTLKTNLHKISALTYHTVDAYKDGVENTCDAVDGSIKSMYALMAKCEELSKSMQPIYKLQAQIKDIKRLLDMFETQVSREEKKK